MSQKIRWRLRPSVPMDIRRRADHRTALPLAERDSDHVAAYQIRSTHSDVEPVGDVIYQALLGDEVDMYLGVLADELQHERKQRDPGRARVDPQRAAWCCRV